MNKHKGHCCDPKGKIRVEMAPKKIVSFAKKGKKIDKEDLIESTSLWTDEGFEKD